jgi:mannose-6-phosphate isomerase-like protein (cupin superfamily)
MNIVNFLTAKLNDISNCHEGIGTLKSFSLFEDNKYDTKLRFIHYTVLPPTASIGYHKHGDDEEVYIILEGNGLMKVDNEEKIVSSGDAIINKPYSSHGLTNNSNHDLKIIVFEVGK